MPGQGFGGAVLESPEALSNSIRIASECHVKLDLSSRKLPAFPAPGGGEPYLYLRGLALQGLSERYDGLNISEARRYWSGSWRSSGRWGWRIIS